MAFSFLPDARYRMPVVFGPMPGPRQAGAGTRQGNHMGHLQVFSASFLTEPSALEDLLPAGFELCGDPVVTVEVTLMSELAWLAGRGYNTLGVKIPVRYCGKTETVQGPFLAVLWENKADPIITGREELGFAKLFCDIDQPQVLDGRHILTAGWEGYRFFEMELSSVLPAQYSAQSSDGLLHYRYIPSVGDPGRADFSGVVLSPAGAEVKLIDHATADAKVSFKHSTWEQLPTLVHIVNMLADLPQVESRGGGITNCYHDVEVASQRLVD